MYAKRAQVYGHQRVKTVIKCTLTVSSILTKHADSEGICCHWSPQTDALTDWPPTAQREGSRKLRDVQFTNSLGGLLHPSLHLFLFCLIPCAYLCSVSPLLLNLSLILLLTFPSLCSSSELVLHDCISLALLLPSFPPPFMPLSLP